MHESLQGIRRQRTGSRPVIIILPGPWHNGTGVFIERVRCVRPRSPTFSSGNNAGLAQRISSRRPTKHAESSLLVESLGRFYYSAA